MILLIILKPPEFSTGLNGPNSLWSNLREWYNGRSLLDHSTKYSIWEIFRIYIPLVRKAFNEYDNRIILGTHTHDVDAFADASDNNGASADKVHVRVQQRNGRKCITTVQGLAEDLDTKRILKAFKKNFSCNGAIVKDDDCGEILQLSGDQRTNVRQFLVDQQICMEVQIVLHGF